MPKLGHTGADEMGNPIGSDPSNLSKTQLEALGHTKTPLLKLIRKNCLDCVGESVIEVKQCSLTKCVFWPYRMGKNPFSERTGNPAGAAALANYRASKKASEEDDD